MRPAGRIQVSREPYGDHATYGRLLADAATTGCCPVWITDRGLRSLHIDWDPAPVLTDLARRDAASVLTERWPGRCLHHTDCLAPFGAAFPGLTEPPEPLAVEISDDGRPALLGLAPVARPADVPAAAGWFGMINAWDDVAGPCAVLRSWEDRFGALLTRMDSATLELSVAAPPRTEQDCLGAGAEHYAFCCDTYRENPGTLRDYARSLRGGRRWRFWWD